MNFFKSLFHSQLFEFQKNPKGSHQIGGSVPSFFTIPDNEFLGGFQYLGMLSHKDEVMDWLPFDLHMICPIYLDIDDGICLDYSDPVSPKLIHPEGSSAVTSAFDELTGESFIEFESINLELVKVDEIDDMECYGIAGKPTWVQNSETPKCPKSGKKMKFVCQMMTFGEVPTKEKNFESVYTDFDHMCFWGDGSLYVYMNPDEKTVCYFIQNT